MNAIEIKGLSKTYANGTQALSGIDLNIKEWDFFALLGANGAGKTTIINILTSLVNKSEWEVRVFWYDIDQDPDDAKLSVGVVPQEFNFNIFEKVIDIVVNQAGYYGLPRSVAEPRAHEILDALGLSDKKNVASITLSGGMKRRLMIARALIHKPRLLILDEPTAGVDVELRRGMWDYLIRLNKEDKVTILLTTHYLEEVEQLCKHAAMIKNGVIVKNDTVKNLLKSSEKETYLIDIKEYKELRKMEEFDCAQVDDQTLEVTLNRGQSLNEFIELLSKNEIEVIGMRPKWNRLEELFLSTVKK